MTTLRLTRDGGTRVLRGGRVLVGGAPLRMLRLSKTGADLVSRWFAGVLVDDTHRALARRLVQAGIAHPSYRDTGWSTADVTVVVPVRDHPVGVPGAVIVDDGSIIPVSGAAVRHPQPRGPAAARNAGWRIATTELVAFVDADVRLTPGWLDPILAHFADPDVAAVAPRVRSRAGTGLLARYEAVASSLDLGGEPAQVRPGGVVSYVPSATLVVRRSVLDRLGGFDESMRFGEDVDLIWRMVDAGLSVRYEPTSTVEHAPRASWAGWVRQRFEYGTSAAPLAVRHGRAVAPVRMSVWSALSWLAVAAGRPRTGIALALATAALLPVKLRRAGLPRGELVRLAVTGHWYAGRLLADATTRSWWPISLALPWFRRGRWVLAAALARHLPGQGGIDPARWVLLRAADDLAYGAGVWWGAVRDRTVRPLLPDFTEWRP
ncbi:mycofactocin biosynthesis glycosyltransferase MftF [Labedaea rhizosphaerae]|uniref:Mycofactocin system glycosyltransferase n=1 Tax=Labedaea rhizosphaerae TaxID=598644 RepID=A0A4V3CYF8_LABRH|nr:mycofactocin biosynthesis glycosyltransferase MftF [Labedaea rhizosphaerae]TDP93978.1 mycofactocin system glycosyltransferase [Labedaea rhizosphaerae]